MKRLLSSVLLLLFILLPCGCAFSASDHVETLKGWTFQYNEGTNDYSVFFGLLNSKDEYIAADVDADIRIVDENGNELYAATRSVSRADFSYYTSQIAGERYLANIRIKAADIAEGTSTSGTVYLTIYKENSVRFDEVSCPASYCLPIKSVTLETETLPATLEVKGFDGKTESVLQVTDVAYDFDSSISPKLNVTLAGVKTYSGENALYKSTYDIISYKLYDSGGYLVNSGNVYLRSLAVGDKFKDDSIVIYDITPGEAYTLKLMEYAW